MGKILKFSLIIAALLVSCNALAGDYVVGLARATPGEAYFDFPTATHVRNDNSPAAYLLTGGYNWSNSLGLELGYGRFGTWTATDPTPGSTLHSSLSTRVTYAAATSSMALGGNFSLYGKVGLAANHEEIGTYRRTSVRPMVGFGGSYALTEHWSARLGFDYFGSTRLGTQQKVSLGLGYKF